MLTHQVFLHHARPDKVVGSQDLEHSGHPLGIEIALVPIEVTSASTTVRFLCLTSRCRIGAAMSDGAASRLPLDCCAPPQPKYRYISTRCGSAPGSSSGALPFVSVLCP